MLTTPSEVCKLKARAKSILKAFRAGESEAIKWVEARLKNRPVKLMVIQHILAVEAGYKNWTEFLVESKQRQVVGVGGGRPSKNNLDTRREKT